MPKESEYNQNIYIVTGAASGMGKATTLKLLSQGAIVYACDWNSQALGVFRNYELAVICPLDVSDSKACESLVLDVFETRNRIDGLVNFMSAIRFLPSVTNEYVYAPGQGTFQQFRQLPIDHV